ncbi:MAG: hypothetical protein L6R36_008905 [Xanthoria steineri]|nr:MAG: hypothetical protein L6R36_008905 [Xanthoria steineri]
MFTNLLGVLGDGLPSGYRGLSAFALLGVAWLSWYMWRFTIRPALHPMQPKEMPYWIPVIGHGIQFFKDSEATFTKSRKYFGDVRKPFALTVMRQRLYIVTSPQDVSAIYRNTTTLTFDEFVRDMMLSFGASEEGVRKMWESRRTGGNVGSLHKVLAHAGEDYYRQQFHPGDRLNDLWSNIQDRLSASLQWNAITSDKLLSAQHDVKTVSLMDLCQDVLFSSATSAVFGDRLLQLAPKLLKAFIVFDDESWKLTYKLPPFLAKEMHKARQEIFAALQSYFALPRDGRTGATWVVDILETEMRRIGLEEHDIAALFGMPFWVINGNAYKLCFWYMAYLVNDAELLRAVRAEVDPAISQGLLGLEGRLEECPRLVAVYHEVLRCHTASASVRSVAAPTDLGDVTLDAGAKVLLPYRQLHFDASVFGPHVEEFRADRFLPTQISAKARVSVLSVAARPIAQGVMWQGENCLRLQRSWFIVTISMLLLCTLEWRKQGSLDVT